MSYPVVLLPDESACKRTRVYITGPTIQPSIHNDDNVEIRGLIWAEDDFQPEPGCRLELDVLCFHRAYTITKDQDGNEKKDAEDFLLYASRAYRRFYLEKNRVEDFEVTVPNFDRFLSEENLIIKFMPRWEPKR